MGYRIILVWDGAPHGWRRHRGDVNIWALGTNLEVNVEVNLVLLPMGV